MTNLKDIEKVGRQTWLATIGTYAKGWDVISSKVSTTFDDANKFVNDMIENGEKVEADFKEKVKSSLLLDQRISALKTKLGVDSRAQDKLEELNKKVSLLTDEIDKLVDARLAAAKKQAKKTVNKKPVVKAPATKTVADVKPVVKDPVKVAPLAAEKAVEKVVAKTVKPTVSATPAAKPKTLS